MPYNNETGHSYFESNAEAEQWGSTYAPEMYFFPSYFQLQPIVDNTPFIPEDPLTWLPLCLQCHRPYHAEAVCPTTFQNIPPAVELLYCNAGASIYLEGNVTGSSSSIGFITLQRETRPCDPEQIIKECTYCKGPPHSPTKCPAIIQGAWSLPLQRQTSPIPIPPKPKEDLTSSQYPNCSVKPLPKRARQPPS